MLNGMLAVGVPMMALLAAALYMLKRSMTESPQGPGTRTTCRDPWGAAMANRRQSSTSARRRNTQGSKMHSDDNNSQASSSSESPDSGFGSEDQCEICFEDKDMVKVQLYPCGHSDICQACVIKLMVSNRRECPFCRGRIDGFEEIGTGQVFG